MKLKYNFELMEMDTEFVAVPTGDHSDDLRSIIKLNQSAAEIFELLKEDTTEEKLVHALKEKYDTDRDKLAVMVHNYLEQLFRDDLLLP